jgi:thiamine biosynthesis lipoprotein
MNTPEPLADARHFSHEAMRTTFTLRLRGVDAATGRGIARECFDRIDFLESRLSRYLDGSDISRINRLRAGETLYLSGECHQCLLAALDAHARTAGLFDITLGTRIAHRKSGDPDPPPTITGSLLIHPDAPAVTCIEAGREIDLGGIGKGFALDLIARDLAAWDVPGALLAAGASSLLALGSGAWPVDLTGNRATVRVSLAAAAISASGSGIQGAHIIHPAGAAAMPAAPVTRVWVAASSATLAEIWSTALMLVEPAQIPEILARENQIHHVHIEQDGLIHAIPLTRPSA